MNNLQSCYQSRRDLRTVLTIYLKDKPRRVLWYIRLFIQFTRVMGSRAAVVDGWNAWRFRRDPEGWEDYRCAGYDAPGAWLEWLNDNDQYADEPNQGWN